MNGATARLLARLPALRVLVHPAASRCRSRSRCRWFQALPPALSAAAHDLVHRQSAEEGCRLPAVTALPPRCGDHCRCRTLRIRASRTNAFSFPVLFPRRYASLFLQSLSARISIGHIPHPAGGEDAGEHRPSPPGDFHVPREMSGPRSCPTRRIRSPTAPFRPKNPRQPPLRPSGSTLARESSSEDSGVHFSPDREAPGDNRVGRPSGLPRAGRGTDSCRALPRVLAHRPHQVRLPGRRRSPGAPAGAVTWIT